jgi:hypothetical protein
MNETLPPWRYKLFTAGWIILLVSAGFYVLALIIVPQTKPLNVELRMGAEFFLVGSVLNLLAFALVLFGAGWKRFPLALAALLTLPFYGFTLY